MQANHDLVCVTVTCSEGRTFASKREQRGNDMIGLEVGKAALILIYAMGLL